MKRTRPTLYVNTDGPLLIPGDGDNHDMILQAEIAPYAKTFMLWALGKFDVVLLSERSFAESAHLLKKLGIPSDRVPIRGFDANHTDFLHTGKDFFWVDDAFLPTEIAWLARHEQSQRALSVDPHVGVTEAHKARLEAALAATRNA